MLLKQRVGDSIMEKHLALFIVFGCPAIDLLTFSFSFSFLENSGVLRSAAGSLLLLYKNPLYSPIFFALCI